MEEEGDSFDKYSTFKEFIEENGQIEEFLKRIGKELPDEHDKMLN